MSLENKTILITGGAGFFGKKFVEVVLKSHNPKSIRVYDNREFAGVEMEREIRDDRFRFFFGDVRDKERLNRAMNGVDVVVHAAALKHVPICEYNPLEAIKTNIDGAVNVIDSAIDNKVEKVMAISTDKAVYPVNLYGATKMVAEKLFTQANSYSGASKTIFSCVRYGNVVASSGSVVPLFKNQHSQNKDITITDEKMTRFWITLEQGVKFVINCIDESRGGEIFVPKIPSMKIIELADVAAPGANKKIVGIRPGEKLHEVLLTKEEAQHTKEFENHFVIEPEFPFWDKENYKDITCLPKDFEYASNTNGQWVTRDQMQEILKTI